MKNHFIILLGIYCIVSFLFYRKKETTLIKQLLNLSFFIYAILVISVTLFPIPIDKRLIQSMIETSTITKNNFIPFSSIYTSFDFNSIGILVKQIGGNVLLLMPLGFYAPLMWHRFRKIKLIILLGFLTSLGIESLQFLISGIIGVTYRSFVVDDIILNTLGTIIGFWIVNLLRPLLIKIINNIAKDSEKNIKLLNL